MQYGFYSNSIIKFPPQQGYPCNSHGYRTHEFDDWSNHCLVLGESNTFGDGVPDGKTFCERLEKAVGQRIYNLGHPGASGEECVRILYSFGQTPAPKKVIVVWPSFVRRNHQDLDKIQRITGADSDLTPYIAHNTDGMNVAHFLQQMFFVEQWCEWRGCECYHFLTTKHDSDLLQRYGKAFDRLMLHSFEHHARDIGDHGGHFGAGSHVAFMHTVKNLCF